MNNSFNKTIIIAATFLIALPAFSQSLAPATSEDLNDFDQQLQEAQSPPAAKPPVAPARKPHDNFGALVSQEAKSLKDAEAGQKQKMGQWVREQKQKSGSNSAGGLQKSSQGASSSNKDANAPSEQRGNRRK